MALTWTASVLVFVALQPCVVIGQFWGAGGGFGGVAGGAGGGLGTCTFDLKCYLPKPGCSLKNQTPFWRTTPISCEDCLALCQDKLAKPVGPYCCRSVVYDAATKTCDLFAVVSQGSKNTGSYPGRIYFQPTGAPGCAANNTNNGTAAPAANVCNAGETAKLIAVKDYSVASLTGKEATGISDADSCGKACMSGKLPDGTAIACKAAQFKDGKCTLATDAPKSEADQTATPGATFFRLYCFPSDLVKNCPDTFFEAPQMVLVGQNKLTVDKPTLDECIKACLNSQKDNGFVCKSAIFYYNDQKLNCILNVESSKTKPDLYAPAGPDDKEVYFETDCGGGVRFRDAAKKRTKAFKDALMDLPADAPWTMWSPCHGRKSMQVRWRPCGEKDSRKCTDKQERSCDPGASRKAPTNEPGKKTGEEKLIDDKRKRARDQVAQDHH